MCDCAPIYAKLPGIHNLPSIKTLVLRLLRPTEVSPTHRTHPSWPELGRNPARATPALRAFFSCICSDGNELWNGLHNTRGNSDNFDKFVKNSNSKLRAMFHFNLTENNILGSCLFGRLKTWFQTISLYLWLWTLDSVFLKITPFDRRKKFKRKENSKCTEVLSQILSLFQDFLYGYENKQCFLKIIFYASKNWTWFCKHSAFHSCPTKLTI